MTFFCLHKSSRKNESKLLNPMFQLCSMILRNFLESCQWLTLVQKFRPRLKANQSSFTERRCIFCNIFRNQFQNISQDIFWLSFRQLILCIIMNDILYLIVKQDIFVTLYIRLYRLHINNDSWRNTALIFLFDRFQEKMIFIPIYTISAPSPP